MSTRSGRIRSSAIEASPPRTRKGVSPPRSPARSRKSSPPAANTRKSPSRKSPSRKPASKFPARKSPSRTTKEATETAALKSPGKRASIRTDVTVKLQDFTKQDIYRNTRSRRSEYSIKDLTPQKDLILNDVVEPVNGVDFLSETNEDYGLRNRKPVEEVAPRRSSRLREFNDIVPDIRRSLSNKTDSKSISKSISQSLETYSEGSDDEQPTRSELVTRKLATPLRESLHGVAQTSSRWEFGGRIGSIILLIVMPLVAFTVLISCSKSCNPQSLYTTTYTSLLIWFNWQSLAVISSQYTLQAALALIPIFGIKVDRMDETGLKLYSNAFFSSIFTITILFLLNHFNVFNYYALLNNYLRLAVISYSVAVILSIILYIKSKKYDDSDLNPYGNTGYGLYDFCMGREIHPIVKGLDVKIWISRISNTSALVLSVLIFTQGFQLSSKDTANITLENYKEFLTKVQLKPTTLLFSMMQIIYILNFIMKEHKITSTFYWQSEGVGYFQTVASAFYPFIFTTISKFVADTNLSLSTNTLIFASGLYLLGFFIMLISNNIKHEFRKNPLHPRLSRLDSMPTFHGKKLLISNIWGVVRHPNYAGDILIHIALALPGILSKNFIAAFPAVLTIFVLMHRAWRDHARCRRRYGAAWERYCKRVPSVIIPKVL